MPCHGLLLLRRMGAARKDVPRSAFGVRRSAFSVQRSAAQCARRFGRVRLRQSVHSVRTGPYRVALAFDISPRSIILVLVLVLFLK
jgi:hypothetical protein